MTEQNVDQIILSELEKIVTSMGDWRKSIVLGGGVALLVYDTYLAKTNAKPVGTNDMDWLIERKPMVSPTQAEPVSKILEAQGYTYRTKNLGNPPVTSYVKEVADQEVEVEFLTHNQVRQKADVVEIPGAKVTAQTLSYLEMSLKTVVAAKLPNGIEFNVVAPEAWVFHKGLTFVRRKKGSSKQYKDLYGIWFVLTQLGDLSILTKKMLTKIQDEHSASWKKDFKRNLQQWVDNASPNDLEKLIVQDPQRRLTEIVFRGLVIDLVSGA